MLISGMTCTIRGAGVYLSNLGGGLSQLLLDFGDLLLFLRYNRYKGREMKARDVDGLRLAGALVKPAQAQAWRCYPSRCGVPWQPVQTPVASVVVLFRSVLSSVTPPFPPACRTESLPALERGKYQSRTAEPRYRTFSSRRHLRTASSRLRKQPCAAERGLFSNARVIFERWRQVFDFLVCWHHAHCVNQTKLVSPLRCHTKGVVYGSHSAESFSERSSLDFRRPATHLIQCLGVLLANGVFPPSCVRGLFSKVVLPRFA